MKKRILFTFALAFGGLSAFSQTVTATLRDAKSGEPMAFTNCVLLKMNATDKERTASKALDSTFDYGTTTSDRSTML